MGRQALADHPPRLAQIAVLVGGAHQHHPDRRVKRPHRLHQVDGGEDIDLHGLLRDFPGPGHIRLTRQVKHRVRLCLPYRRRQLLRVQKVRLDSALAGLYIQAHHLVPALLQLLPQIPPHKPLAAGNQRPHWQAFSLFASWRSWSAMMAHSCS